MTDQPLFWFVGGIYAYTSRNWKYSFTGSKLFKNQPMVQETRMDLFIGTTLLGLPVQMDATKFIPLTVAGYPVLSVLLLELYKCWVSLKHSLLVLYTFEMRRSNGDVSETLPHYHTIWINIYKKLYQNRF